MRFDVTNRGTFSTAAVGELEFGTILARFIGQAAYFEQAVAAVDARTDLVPLTPWQLDGLMFGFEGDEVTVCATFLLRGPVDLRRLDRALGLLCERHEALRTHIIVDDIPLQRLVSADALDKGVLIDVGAAPAADLAEVGGKLWDLTRQPADVPGAQLRAAICRLEPDVSMLHLQVHHYFIDAFASGILIEELWQLYAADADTLPPQAIGYGEAALAQAQYVASTGTTEDGHVRYWNAQFDRALACQQAPVALVGTASDAASTGERVVACRVWDEEDASLLRDAAVALQAVNPGVMMEAIRRSLPEAAHGGPMFMTMSPLAGRAHDRRLRDIVASTLITCPIIYERAAADVGFQAGAQLAMQAVMQAVNHSGMPPLVALRRRSLEFAHLPFGSGHLLVVNHVNQRVSTGLIGDGTTRIELPFTVERWTDPAAPLVSVGARPGVVEIVTQEDPDRLVVGINYNSAVLDPRAAQGILDGIERHLEDARRVPG